eukprot:TRINITY_DN2432_c0_g1_i4.p1 TRINITY_DN2432_c0_g1~~TRINITY_DN2432_c0_g1_i4.p1  ORF type:complete len:537 (+),score=118.77 TRINITY_DN2432_c0_g1_i4:83-1612(+)
MRTGSLLSIVASIGAVKPNIIFFLTDDQDQMLGGSMPATAPGGATPIPKTQKLLGDGGMLADNMYIHTPICCPSRAETFTGRYFHNLKVDGQCPAGYGGQDDEGNLCCMHVDEKLVNNYTMATGLSDAGYKVGMFGKYLNYLSTGPPPPGFDAWMANGGGAYYAPQFFTHGITGLPDGSVHFNETDYTTAVVGNYSNAWIREVKDEPFVAFINPKACHEPFLPSPWYNNTWEDDWPATAPRPVSWNTTKQQRANHHPTIANMDLLSDETATCIDETFKNRWRTLLSVDDLIADTHQLCVDLGIVDRTYFIYSSDHGFQLGELNLAMDKRNVYEFDIKIHLAIKGPGIPQGATFSQPATNVDIAPTILELAGVTSMQVDGRSLVPYLKQSSTSTDQQRPWRNSTYHEYYFVGLPPKCGQNNPIETPDNNFIAVRHQHGSPFGNILYAEFTTGTQGPGFVNFSNIDFYELFDMDADPWQLNNIYNSTTQQVRDALHQDVHQWLQCKGTDCQ